MVFSLLLKLLFFNSLIAKVDSQSEVGAELQRERGNKHSLSAFKARHYSHWVSTEVLLFCCGLVTVPGRLIFPCLAGVLLLLGFFRCFFGFFAWFLLIDLTQNLPAIHEISGIKFRFPLLKQD